MKKFRLFLFLLCIQRSVFAANSQSEISGLVIDETVTKVGHLFYEEFVSNIESINLTVIVTVREKLEPFAGNVISIDIDDNMIFQENINMRATGLEEKVHAAQDALKSKLQQSPL